MKRVVQSRTGADGNCLNACIASILELPLKAVPEFGDDWFDDLNDFLGKRGLSYKRVPIDSRKPSGWSTIEGISPRGGLHACVALYGELIWDPHPIEDGTGQGLVEPRYYGLIEPLKGHANDAICAGKTLVPGMNFPKYKPCTKSAQPGSNYCGTHDPDKVAGRKRAVFIASKRKNWFSIWRRTGRKGTFAEFVKHVDPAHAAEILASNGAQDGVRKGVRMLNEVRGKREASSGEWTCKNCGAKSDRPYPHVVTVKRPDGEFESSYSCVGKIGDRADMLALKRNTTRQGGPFFIQETTKSGRERTIPVKKLAKGADAFGYSGGFELKDTSAATWDAAEPRMRMGWLIRNGLPPVAASYDWREQTGKTQDAFVRWYRGVHNV